MIWEPFAMALVLGLLMSAGLYFAYLWPQVEPDEDEVPPAAATTEDVKPEPEPEPKPEPEKESEAHAEQTPEASA